MRQVFVATFALALALSSFMPMTSYATSVDLAIASSSIRFSEEVLYAGDTVRIYATIKNKGDTDSTAQVFFYQSDRLIGSSQLVSVLADGSGDDVYVDFKLPEGSFNIRAVIQGADPVDTNSSNDVAITPLFKTISDNDRDEVMNEDDNCIDVKNVDQANLDGDAKGDACDKDLDNDNVLNDDDAFPRDPSKSQEVVAPPPVVEPAPVVKPVVIEAPKSVVVAPAVQGVQDDVKAESTPTDVGEPTEVALDLSGLGYGGGPVSTQAAHFTFEQKNWHTYEFVAVPPLGGGDYTYAWDFGDGATSVQSTISHTFSSSGVFKVTLASLDEAGVVTTDEQTLSISFFHLSNPLLLATLGALLLILVGLLVLILRLRRGEEV